MQKQLPDILTSTQYWAAIATLWAAAGAWFTFFSADLVERRNRYRNVWNFLNGIEAELDLISGWASGGEEDVGYLQSETAVSLTRKHEDWFNPSRQIFSFDVPLLRTFTTSGQLYRLTDIIGPLVTLNYSIHRLFDLHEELRAFVNSCPELNISVQKKMLTKPNVYTEQEKEYMNVVFGFNKRLHQQLIGGRDSSDNLCLYHSFRKARDAARNFNSHFRPEPQPKWYVLLHIAASWLVINSLWQIARWLWP